MSNGTTALARHNDKHHQITVNDPVTSSRLAVTARSLEDVYRVAEAVAASGIYGVKNADDAFVRMLTGLELGLGMAQSLRGIYVINSRPSLDAALMMGVCLSHPDVCEYFQLVESTSEKATYVTKRRGAPKEVTLSFTIEEARKAGLATKDTWQKFPANMLRARASSNLARAVYPDLTNGLYIPDEAEDIPPPEPVRGQVTSSRAVANAADAESDKIERDIAARLKAARDLPAFAKEIKDVHGLTDAARARLRELYVQRQKEIKAEHAARDAAKKPADKPAEAAPPPAAPPAQEEATHDREPTDDEMRANFE